jgi:hypothetical protein
MFLKINNDEIVYPYNINFLRGEFPNTSFPNDIQSDSAMLLGFRVYRVWNTPHPLHDALLQKCVELQPILIDGKWNQQWQVQNLTGDETQMLYRSNAAEVRANRYRLLVETDWSQFKDVSDSVSNVYTVYRQELRDIPNQPDFPFGVVWPTAP